VSLTQWVFKEKGVLRVGTVKHHRVGESTAPSAYTIMDEVVCHVILLVYSILAVEPPCSHDVIVIVECGKFIWLHIWSRWIVLIYMYIHTCTHTVLSDISCESLGCDYY